MTGENIILRPYRLSDAGVVLKAITESLPELLPWMSWAHQDYRLKEVRDYINNSIENWKDGFSREFAIIDAYDNSYIGGCGLNRIENRTANLGYWVRTQRAGRGVATTSTRLLAEFGFRELSLCRLEIVVDVDNRRSQRVATKAGALREGVLRNRLNIRGTLRDAIMFSLIPSDLK